MDRVTKYAQEVIDGEHVVGQLHYLACKRHLDDLAKQRTEQFPYYWDEDASSEIIRFAETLTIAEGEYPKPVKLLDCQAFDLGCTFGWKKVVNDKRRFRRRYKSMARQNGKTFENGIMGTYVCGFGGYHYGKLFTAATKKRQSRLAWEEMKKFITIDDDLHDLFKVKDYKSLIECEDTHCTIEALSKESGLDDGFRSIFVSVDEIHQHKDNKIYKALYNGTKSLPETLVSMITTRGDQLSSFCKEMDDYSVNILKGLVIAEDFFVDIYAMDKEDDIWDERNWIKANPFLCSTLQGLESLRTDSRTAKDMGGSDLRDFLVKSLNVWVQNTDDQFINVDKFKLCGTNTKLERYRGQSCYVGIDLSSGGDLTTYSLEFKNLDIEKGFYLYSHSFMPKGRLEEHIETDLAPYDLWVEHELITITGGADEFKNDYKFIVSDLKKIQEEFDLKFLAIGYDPHNADGVLSDLEDFGCPLVEIKQSARFLNDATVDMRLNVKSKLIEYDKSNELLVWSFINAAVVENSFKEIKIDKKPRQKFKRIDPVDACIDAHTCYMKNVEGKVDINLEDAQDDYLKMMGWK